MELADHPTVTRLAASPRPETQPIDAAGLRQLAFDCGADDAGLVEIGRVGLDPQRDELLRNYPWTKTVLSFVVRMAREPLRGPPRSVANLEFHRAGHEVDSIAASIVAALEARGIRAVNPSMGFPMEMSQSSGFAPWIVSHKPIAVEAGLGHRKCTRSEVVRAITGLSSAYCETRQAGRWRPRITAASRFPCCSFGATKTGRGQKNASMTAR